MSGEFEDHFVVDPGMPPGCKGRGGGGVREGGGHQR